MKRNKDGTFQYKPFKTSNFTGLKLMVGMVVLGASLNWLYTPSQDPISPFISEVKAQEPIIIKSEPVVVKTEKEQIVDYINEVFGKDAEDAFKVLECENKGLNPKAINHNSNGSTDHNIFQVNSVHTKRYGESFKTDWHANIDVSYKIFQASGWSAWACSSKTLGIKSFWEK